MLGVSFVSAEKPEVIKGAEKIKLVKKDISKPLRDMPPAARPAGVKFIRQNHKFIESAPWQPDGALQTSAAPSINAPTAGSSFEGVGQGVSGYSVCCVPPDTVGDVGPNHYVQMVNIDLAVFNKSTGARILGPIPTNTIWTGFSGRCSTNNDGDPIVLYDQFADRWIVSQFVASSPYKECVAVSTTGDPTGSYHRYEYDFGNTFPDYPKVGIWPTEDAYFITYNMFTNRFVGPRVCAYQRSKLINGQTNTAQCFSPSSSYHSLLPADLDGSTMPAAGTDAYFINRYSSGLRSWRANMNWTTPSSSTFTGPTTVSGVQSYSAACSGGGTCVPQAGTSRTLDSLGDRLMHRAAYRVLSGNQSLVVNHSVTASSTTGIRWYELRPSGSGLTAFQQGTYTPDSTHRWMGSAAMDKSGNLGVGYSASSSSINPAIRYTGRLASDPLGTLQAESTIINGSGSQTTHSRWGDYSSINVDPSDDCTFWFTTEYLSQTGVFNWRTRIGSFKFSTCGGGGGTNNPPTAGFTFSCTGLTCNFTDTSTDDAGISSRSWNFGDGGTSTSTNPSHTYASGGTFAVTLTVTDTGGLQDSDAQNVTVAATNAPPTANFTFNCTGLTCSFTDTSTDDAGISSRSWNFGDGGTSTATNPSHTYASGGTYAVTLTVTDTGGLQDGESKNVTVSSGGGGGITLTATGYKVKGVQHADLSWSGATSTNVDVFRNNVKIVTTPNDGAHTDNIGKKGGGTYTYRVCEAGTTTCSNNVNVVF
jgi:PKD repeat protein